MSHFNVCVFVENDGSGLKELAEKVDKIVENFDINKRVEPYKYYIKDEQIQQMAKNYKLDPTNLLTLSEKLEDWNGDKGGVDEIGFYGISTNNPVGHTDYWSMPIEIQPKDYERFLLGQDGDGKIIKAIVTLHDAWIDGPWIYGTPTAEQERERELWEKKIRAILDEYKGKNIIAFLIDCHV